MPGCGHNCVSVTIITKTGPLSALGGEWHSVSSAGCGGESQCQLPWVLTTAHWSHSHTMLVMMLWPRAVSSPALCEILSHWQQGRTVHSGLSLLGHNQLSWLSYSEWGRVGTLAPAPVAPARSWLSELFTEHWTWRQNPDTRRHTGTGGSRGHTDVLLVWVLTQTGGMWDWQHELQTRRAALVTHNTVSPGPGQEHSQSWENRAEQVERPELRTGSAGPRLYCPALSRASCRGVARETQSCEIWGRVYHVLSPPGDPGYYVSRTHTSAREEVSFVTSPASARFINHKKIPWERRQWWGQVFTLSLSHSPPSAQTSLCHVTSQTELVIVADVIICHLCSTQHTTLDL